MPRRVGLPKIVLYDPRIHGPPGESKDLVLYKSNTGPQEIDSTQSWYLRALVDDYRDWARDDRRFIAEDGDLTSEADQYVCLCVLASKMLNAWARPGGKTLLVINGPAATEHGEISPTSYVAGRIAVEIHKMNKNEAKSKAGRVDDIPIYFFCGRRAGCGHTLSTPAGIIDCLVAQLASYIEDIDVSKKFSLEEIKEGDVERSLARFEEVLGMLKRDSKVVCIIDNLKSYLAHGYFEHDLGLLLRKLVKLASEEKGKKSYGFKLLLTETGGLMAVMKLLVPEDKVLEAPSQLGKVKKHVRDSIIHGLLGPRPIKEKSKNKHREFEQ